MTNIPQHLLDAEMASATEAANVVVIRRPGERSDESSASLEHFLARGVAAQAAADRAIRSDDMTKTITDPIQAILAEELAGQTENWSDLAVKIAAILRDHFAITERHKTSG